VKKILGYSSHFHHHSKKMHQNRYLLAIHVSDEHFEQYLFIPRIMHDLLSFVADPADLLTGSERSCRLEWHY